MRSGRALIEQICREFGKDWLLKELVAHNGYEDVKKSLADLRPYKPSRNSIAIAQWLSERQKENDQKATEAIRAGKAKTTEEVNKLRKPPSLAEAARAVMPKATEGARRQAVKRFDHFSFDDPKRGFGCGRFYK
jgi:hypothetical protein